jgi:cyclase
MYRSRVIPVLLLSGHGLVKTQKFKDPVYIGDPVNAVRIFSEKEADELVLLDIGASLEKREPNYELIAEIGGECLMPMAYGGGITSLDQVRKLIRSGVEKVIINSFAATDPGLITEAAKVFGSQAVVGGIDVRRTLLQGMRVLTHSGSVDSRNDPVTQARRLVGAGAGEILLNSIDRDGTMTGYDLPLVKAIADAVDVPVVACGGAGTPQHLAEAIGAGASAAAAGSMFVFHGKKRAVLINYSNQILST